MTVTGNVSASNFVKQFRDRRLPALLIGHGLTWFSEWHELTGEASDYVVTMDSPRVIAPDQQEWVERYKKMFGEELSLAPAGQQGYDYMTVGLTVLQKAGTLDYEKLIDTARDIDYQGIWQRYNFAEEKGENARSEEHTSELQSLMRNSYAVCCLNKKQTHIKSQSSTAIEQC